MYFDLLVINKILSFTCIKDIHAVSSAFRLTNDIFSELVGNDRHLKAIFYKTTIRALSGDNRIKEKERQVLMTSMKYYYHYLTTLNSIDDCGDIHYFMNSPKYLCKYLTMVTCKPVITKEIADAMFKDDSYEYAYKFYIARYDSLDYLSIRRMVISLVQNEDCVHKLLSSGKYPTDVRDIVMNGVSMTQYMLQAHSRLDAFGRAEEAHANTYNALNKFNGISDSCKKLLHTTNTGSLTGFMLIDKLLADILGRPTDIIYWTRHSMAPLHSLYSWYPGIKEKIVETLLDAPKYWVEYQRETYRRMKNNYSM